MVIKVKDGAATDTNTPELLKRADAEIKLPAAPKEENLLETIIAAHLLDINPFDQPAVEGSKQTTIEMFEGYGPGVREQLDRYTRDASVTL